MISLLGLAQIPLGLALYGSPLALFVLYTLAVFALLLIYFILSYTRDRRGGNEYGSRYSYGSESLSEGRGRRSSGVEGVVKAGIIGAGLAKLVGGFRNRSRSRGDHPEVVGSRTGSRRGSRRHSGSYVEEEKYSEYEQDSRRDSRRDGEGWKDKLLKIGFIAGTLGAIKYLFERRNHRDRDSDTEDYGPPLGGATAINPENMNDRLEEGRPLPSGQHPLNHQRSTSSLSYSSFMSASREGRRGHGLRDAVAGIGAFGIGRNFFKNRRDKKEQRRLETQRQRELENERRARANNQRHTGDGYPRRSDRRGSWTTSTDISTSTDTPRYDAGIPPPIPAGVFPTAAASAAALSRQRDQQQGNLHPSNTAIPPTGPVSMPQIPQDPQGIFHRESSGSEAYVSAGGRQHRRRSGRGGAAAAAVAAGVAAGEASSSRHDRRQSGSNDNVTTPPVSVKVKVHSDGRHVTLRRLPEEEAAEERRRRSRHGRRRKGSASSLGDTNAGGDRWRRAGNIEQQQADAMRVESQNLAAARSQPEIQPQVQLQIPPQAPPHAQPQIPPQNLPVPLPPPPPIPGSSVGHRPGTTGSVGSPGHDISGTEASADYANNRRRRRAERAQAKQAREARSGPDVEFT